MPDDLSRYDNIDAFPPGEQSAADALAAEKAEYDQRDAALCERIKKGDTAALATLFGHYESFLYAQAHTSWQRAARDTAVDKEDIRQAAYLLLWEVVQHFEPYDPQGQPRRFTAYLVSRIGFDFRDATLGLVYSSPALAHPLRKMRRAFMKANGAGITNPTPAELQQHMGAKPMSIEAMGGIMALTSLTSLHAPASTNGDTEYGQLIPDSAPLPDALHEERATRAVIAELLAAATSELSERERAFFNRWLAEHTPDVEVPSLESLGKQFDIKKSRASQIHQAVMKRVTNRLKELMRQRSITPQDLFEERRQSYDA